MDVFEAIRLRHSYRGSFLPQPVPREDLARIVQAGLLAPSGYNGQSTSFVIVDDPASIARIAEIVASEVVRQARAIVVCIMDPGATRDKEFSFAVEDYSAAVENILLAVTACGYATVWIDGVLRREERARRIGDLLGVPAERVVRVILPIGVPAEAGARRDKKPFSERAWFNRFGAS